MRTAYLDTLYELATTNKDVIGIISDNGAIVYDRFRADFPKQYLNMGISEANMIAAAAGMASCGKIPFAYTIGAFLAYRACEFIRNDVCLQNQNVKIVGTGAGTSYSALGPTHHTTEDIGILRAMPNLTVFCPASPIEVKKVTKAAYEIKGPVYIRLGTNKEQEIYKEDYKFEVGKGVILKEGSDIAFVSTGAIISDVLQVAEKLEKENIMVRVINIHTLKPFDKEIIVKAAQETKAIITIEDHNIVGGVGSAVAETISSSGLGIRFKNIGLNDTFAIGYGSQEQVKKINNIDQETIYNIAKQILG